MPGSLGFLDQGGNFGARAFVVGVKGGRVLCRAEFREYLFYIQKIRPQPYPVLTSYRAALHSSPIVIGGQRDAN